MTPNDNDTMKGFALTTLLTLIEDYHSFNPDTTVPTYAYPTYLEFSQQVARGRPCVYRLDRGVLGVHANNRGGREAEDKCDINHGSEKQRPSSSKDVKRQRLHEEQQSILSSPCFGWTKKSLCELVPEEVEVAVTPDGRADALYSLHRSRRRLRQHAVNGDSGKQEDNGVDGHGHGSEEAGDNQEDVSESEEEGEPEPEPEHVFLQPASTYMSLSALIDKLCPPGLSPSSSSSSPPNIKRPQTSTTPTSTATNTPTKAPVYYLQSQNSNLHTRPLSSLLGSLPPTPPPFSTRVLGDPEAVNVWIGNAQSVTSTHRDPYENLYLVVKGQKRFVLYSPVEEVCLHAETVRTGRWVFEQAGGDGAGEGTGQFKVVMDDNDDDDDDDDDDCEKQDSNASTAFPPSSPSLSSPTIPNAGVLDGEDTNRIRNRNRIPWIPIDPVSPPPPTSKRYPYYRHARPLTVTVSEGEILYLPAGWFHHVTQECGSWKSGEGDEGDEVDGRETVAPCIAVNYWFDMDYSGEKYVMREMVGRLVERIRTGENR